MHAGNYFEKLGDDLNKLGLLENHPGIDPGLDKVHVMLCATGSIGRIALLQRNYELNTRLAERVLQLSQAGVKFGEVLGDDEFVACPHAEPKLLRSLDPDNTGPDWRPPTIIMDDDGSPAAFIKHIGEVTAYALKSKPEIGLYAGTFCDYSNQRWDPRWKRYSHRVSIHHLAAGDSFAPLRFGAFITPPEAREAVAQSSDRPDMLPTASHEDVKHAVSALLELGLAER